MSATGLRDLLLLILVAVTTLSAASAVESVRHLMASRREVKRLRKHIATLETALDAAQTRVTRVREARS